MLTEDPQLETLQVRRDVLSFHGREAIKKKYLTRVREHRLADQIIKGHYWKDGKGCAIGCTLHSSNHWAYEDELGIPNQLAYLQDELFEALPNEQAMLFPEQFLEAIPVAVDLYPAFWRFMLFALLDEAQGLMAFNQNKKAIRQVADFYQRALAGQEISWDEYLTARNTLDTPANRYARGVLDALDPLDPRAAVYAAYIPDTLAHIDNEPAEADFGSVDAMITLQAAKDTRASIWRDKLLECLSETSLSLQL